MKNSINKDVKRQTELVLNAIKTNPEFIISITDYVCALDFKKYAISEEWSGNEFKIYFFDSENVKVNKADFIKYQFQYTDFAIELEEKHAEFIDTLRDRQQDAMNKLLEI